jgi:hypothetical protein
MRHRLLEWGCTHPFEQLHPAGSTTGERYNNIINNNNNRTGDGTFKKKKKKKNFLTFPGGP